MHKVFSHSGSFFVIFQGAFYTKIPPLIVQLFPNRGREMGGGISMFCVGKNGNFDIIGFFKFYFKILVCHVHKTIFKS